MANRATANAVRIVPLNDADEEFISVKQYLASCLLGRGKVEHVRITKIDNPDLNRSFEKKASKLTKQVGWTNTNSLSGDNKDLNMLASRGFVASKGTTGLDFHVGNITTLMPVHMQESSKNSLVELHEPEHTLLYSDVAVGRAYVKDSDWNNSSLPQGYDSFYMPLQNIKNPNREGSTGNGNNIDENRNTADFDLFDYQSAATFDQRDPAEYEHRYFIKDMSHVVPRYIIKFKFAKHEGHKHQSKKQQSTAEQVKEQARRVLMNKPTNTLDDPTFFDPETHQPVTMRQKLRMGGAKLVVPVEVAYEQALSDWKLEDPLITGKKMWLEQQLDLIDEKVRDVNLNYADVLEKINETAASATRHLQEITKGKLDALLSVEVELRRQKEQMLWMDGLVNKNFSSVSKKLETAHRIANLPLEESASDDPSMSQEALRASQVAVVEGQLEFLQIWKHHTLFRNAASRAKPRAHMEALGMIRPDIAVKLDLHVYVDTTLGRTGGGVDDGGLGGSDPVQTAANDRRQLSNTLETIQRESNYSFPPKPSRDLVSHLLQSVVDVEAGRISEVLNEALEHDTVPFPASLHRPSTAGTVRISNGLLDVLAPPSQKDAGAASDVEAFNHKQLYYNAMKASLGEAPAKAKDPIKLAKLKGDKKKGSSAGGKSNNNGKSRNKVEERAAAKEKANMRRTATSVGAVGRLNAAPREENAPKMAKINQQEMYEATADAERLEFERHQAEKAGYLEQQRQLQMQQLERLQLEQKEHEDRLRNQAAQLLRQKQKDAQQNGQNADAHEIFGKQESPAGGYDKNSDDDNDDYGDEYDEKGIDPEQEVETGRSYAGTSSGVEEVPQLLVNMSTSHMKATLDPNMYVPMDVHGTSYSLDALKGLASKFHSGFSMNNHSFRRAQQLKTDLARSQATRAVEELALSELLSPEDARVLYYNLPFFAKPPACQLIYSSAEATGDGRNVNLTDVYTKCMIQEKPCLLLLQSGDYVFGAYLSHPLRVTKAGWAGSPGCFMFSVTLDLKLPYHARLKPTGHTARTPAAFMCEQGKLTIGNNDLVISGNGHCRAALENCYGVGMTPGSSEAACLFAGVSEFSIDEMEVWTVL